MEKLKDLYFGYYQCIVQADNDTNLLKEADERFKSVTTGRAGGMRKAPKRGLLVKV